MTYASDYDFKFIDSYLSKWDQFAQGENSLVPFLRDNKDYFESQLSAALRAKDKRAPSRMVFYTVVQVGGFINIDTELGKEASDYLGKDFPTIKRKQGSIAFYVGDLYLWWEENKTLYEEYSLFEEWRKRDFAKEKVIPMYRSSVSKRDR